MNTCSRCDRPVQVRGLCGSHYVMAHRKGEIQTRDRSTRQRLRRSDALVIRELASGEILPREVIAERTGLHPNAVSDAVHTVRRLFGRNIIATWPREGYELAGPLPGFGP